MSFGPFCNNPQKDRGIPAVQAVTECLIVMVFESPTHNNEQYIVCRDNQKWRQMELLRLDAFLPAHNKTHRGVFAHKNRRDWKKSGNISKMEVRLKNMYCSCRLFYPNIFHSRISDQRPKKISKPNLFRPFGLYFYQIFAVHTQALQKPSSWAAKIAFLLLATFLRCIRNVAFLNRFSFFPTRFPAK